MNLPNQQNTITQYSLLSIWPSNLVIGLQKTHDHISVLSHSLDDFSTSSGNHLAYKTRLLKFPAPPIPPKEPSLLCFGPTTLENIFRKVPSPFGWDSCVTNCFCTGLSCVYAGGSPKEWFVRLSEPRSVSQG